MLLKTREFYNIHVRRWAKIRRAYQSGGGVLSWAEILMRVMKLRSVIAANRCLHVQSQIG